MRIRRRKMEYIHYENDSGIFVDIDKVFDDDCVNIFTDASTHSTSACAGCIVVIGKLEYNHIVEEYEFCPSTASDEAELRAILLGIQTALPYIGPNTRVNLFSDSCSNIGLVKSAASMVVRENIMYYNNTSKVVRHQDSLYGIIDTILRYNINISFFYQKGHCDSNTSMLVALEAFNRINNTNYSSKDLRFMEIISEFNNMVDNKSRICVHNAKSMNNGMINVPFSYIPYTYDNRAYFNQINGANF